MLAPYTIDERHWASCLPVTRGMGRVLELSHQRYDIGWVANVGDILVEEVLGLVLEDAADRGGDVLEEAFEGEDVDEVWDQLCRTGNSPSEFSMTILSQSIFGPSSPSPNDAAVVRGPIISSTS